ncbi:MAG: MinD/ParA family protein, partial [Burkholderiales bacterium]|nr:MinD/ParA family protein [Burkholderiales bacterium]
MDKLVRDQAEGLRRLLRRHAPRVVAIAGGTPRGGQTSVAVELAAALAQQGRDVLLLDETGHACGALGIASHHHLDDVLAGEMPLSIAQTRLRDGFAVLPAEARKMTGPVSGQWPTRLGATAPDIVLIDAAASPSAPLSSLACHAQDVMVVLTPHAESITGAYAWIKRAHLTHAIPRFRLLANRAGESEAAVMCR